METHEKRHNGSESLMSVSKASNDFFKIIYERLKNKENVYTDFLNHEYIVYLTKKDLSILNENNIDKHMYYLDFWQNNKVIEFNGTYWHRNLKLEDTMKKMILEKNHNMKVLFVDECEYYKNKEKIINECIEFLENE